MNTTSIRGAKIFELETLGLETEAQMAAAKPDVLQVERSADQQLNLRSPATVRQGKPVQSPARLRAMRFTSRLTESAGGSGFTSGFVSANVIWPDGSSPFQSAKPLRAPAWDPAV